MGIILEEFKDILSNGSYMFHLHTNYTDGLNNIHDYFNYASKEGIKTIVFTEHVRRHITYNFDDFYSEIKKNEDDFKNIKLISTQTLGTIFRQVHLVPNLRSG